jgi:hypothetical protein
LFDRGSGFGGRFLQPAGWAPAAAASASGEAFQGKNCFFNLFALET